MKLLLLILAGWLAVGNCRGTAARDLLASPAQSIRDLGAQILRVQFVEPSRTNWDRLVAGLKPGTNRAVVENALRSANAVRVDASGAGDFGILDYRLDDAWVVSCSYTNSVLAEVKLDERMNDFWVNPPANFTGPWITYWANGQKSNEKHYQYGRLDGINTSFHPNGATAVVSSFRNGLAEGEETGFYPSGKIKYKGQYRAGNQVGHWIWYTEEGTVESEKDFGK